MYELFSTLIEIIIIGVGMMDFSTVVTLEINHNNKIVILIIVGKVHIPPDFPIVLLVCVPW